MFERQVDVEGMGIQGERLGDEGTGRWIEAEDAVEGPSGDDGSRRQGSRFRDGEAIRAGIDPEIDGEKRRIPEVRYGFGDILNLVEYHGGRDEDHDLCRNQWGCCGELSK